MIERLKSYLATTLIRDGVKILIVNAIGTALALLTHLMFAKWMGVISYGYYVYALSWLNVLAVGAQMGLNTSVVRLVAEYRAKGKISGILGLSWFSTMVVIVVGLVIMTVGGGTIASLRETIDAELFNVLIIMLPLVILLGLLNQRMAILQGFERVVQAQGLLEIIRPLMLIGFVAIATIIMDLSAPLTIGLNFVATLVALIIGVVITQRYTKPEGGIVLREFNSREWLLISFPYLMIGGMNMLLSQSDVLMLGTILGGEAAGLYAPAAKVAMLILFPMIAITSRAAPNLAKIYTEGNMAVLQRQINITTLTSIMTGVLLMLFIIWQREFLLGLFGPDFVVAENIVIILAIGQLVYSLTGGVEVFLLMGPFERINSIIIGVSLAFNLALGIFLIKAIGYEGAAYATVASILLSGVCSCYIIWRRTGILPWKPVETVNV